MGWHRAILLIGSAVLALPSSAIAHGTSIEYQSVNAIELQASYSSGEPLAKAQVSIYAPDDAQTPWQIGTTDEAGRFIFRPDWSNTGEWEVQVRQAGHGELVKISIDADDKAESFATAQTPASGMSTELAYSPLQMGLMTAATIWGCVGTALFFVQRR